MSITNKNISWLRGPFDLSLTAPINAGKVYLIAYDGNAYYNLFYSNETITFKSVSYTKNSSNVPVPLIMLASTESVNNVQLLINASSASYNLILNENNEIELSKTESLAKLNFSHNRQINAGVWYEILQNDNTVKWPVANSIQGTNFTEKAGNVSYVSNLTFMLLPYQGSFWTNGVFAANGITSEGCYTSSIMDTIVTFQNTITGNTTIDDPPTNGLPIQGCVNNSSQGWLNSSYNYCMFTSKSECARGYWYNYCNENDVCGTCRGVCVNNKDCQIEYAFKENDTENTPLSCAPKQTVPSTSNSSFKNKLLLIGAGVALLIFIVVMILFFFVFRRKGIPTMNAYETMDQQGYV